MQVVEHIFQSNFPVVVREGQRKQIEARQVVVGDIIILEVGCFYLSLIEKEGAQIPADMRLAECVNLEVNEALLTGESEPGIFQIS